MGDRYLTKKGDSNSRRIYSSTEGLRPIQGPMNKWTEHSKSTIMGYLHDNSTLT